MAETTKLKEWRRKKADYIRRDPEVDDLVEQLNVVTLVGGGGHFDLDVEDPVLVGLALDTQSGDKPKAALAVSQDVYETRNSIINRADDLLREWYLEHNMETVKSMAEDDREYDEGWEAMVWDFTPAALNEALSQVDDSDVNDIVIEREFE